MMPRRVPSIALAVLLTMVSAGCVHAAELRPLDAAQIPALLAPPARGVRVVALWSLECVYCEPDLEALGKFQRAHPRDIALVTVSTDAFQRSAVIERRLKRLGVDSYQAWAYAAASPERLNYVLDPRWGGELPRTIVVDADGHRSASSGQLTPEQLNKLLPRN